MGRGRNVAPTFDTDLPHVRLFALDLQRAQEAAARQGRSFSEFVRHALAEAVRVSETFYYVRLSDGTYHPSLREVGYEFFENARRFAARSGGEVVRECIQPDAPGRNLPAAGAGLDSVQ